MSLCLLGSNKTHFLDMHDEFRQEFTSYRIHVVTYFTATQCHYDLFGGTLRCNEETGGSFIRVLQTKLSVAARGNLSDVMSADRRNG